MKNHPQYDTKSPAVLFTLLRPKKLYQTIMLDDQNYSAWSHVDLDVDLEYLSVI